MTEVELTPQCVIPVKPILIVGANECIPAQATK